VLFKFGAAPCQPLRKIYPKCPLYQWFIHADVKFGAEHVLHIRTILDKVTLIGLFILILYAAC
jgi:hypothetical protein